MGLDMFLERVTRLTDDEKKLVETYDKKVLAYGIEEVIMTNPDGSSTCESELDDIMPYIHIVEVPKQYWNKDKLKKHFNIPPDALCVMKAASASNQEWTYRWFDNGDNKKYTTIDFSKISEIKDRFIDTHVIRCGYFKSTEIAYWRKAYDLDNMLCKAYDGEVVNCGYHRLNDKMREIILKHEDGKLTSDDIEDTENSIVCYYKWY